MTIERARQLLGTDIADLSDEEVSELINRTSGLCSALIDLAINDIVKCTSVQAQFGHEQNSCHLRSRERSVAG